VGNGSREFVLSGDARAGTDLELLRGSEHDGNGFSWADGGQVSARTASIPAGPPAGTFRRTWLDTFDWRLYRAGLTLELISQARQPGRLVLTGRDGAVLAAEAPAAAVSWPALLTALPAGPLRELLEPVAGVRALMPVARAISKVQELRALNDDDKTIARLAVDRMSVTFPARAQAQARLSLAPVRGYQGQADKLGRELAGLPGISAGRGTALDTALAAAGCRAGEIPGKAAALRLAPGRPAAAALAAILTSQLDSLEANVPGTIRDVDSEFLHDLRIAVRRTRSALKLCGAVLPDGLAAGFRPEFRWLGQLTTPTRDLDVYLLGFDEMAAGLVGASPDELQPFRDYLAASRRTAQRQLGRALRSPRFTRLGHDWRAVLADVHPARKRPSVGQLAEAKIAAACRKALRSGQLITAASPPESLHDLRKRCKELRYLVEMFSSLYDPAQRWQAVRELKALQDCLGEFQDAEVQRAEIRAFAEQMLAARSAPAATLLAMGEIAAGLALRQRRARSTFDDRFADFASPASQARLAALARTTVA
jgi:CHAD domain-containing protein